MANQVHRAHAWAGWALAAGAGALASLLGAPILAMPLFARIGREQVMEHKTRQRILEAVTASPGTSLQDVRRHLGVAWGTAIHHVRALERHGRVVSVRQGTRRRLYAAGTPQARLRSELALLQSGSARDIAALVHERPGIGQPELARCVGVLGPAVSKHLGRLAAAGLVAVERAGASRRYAGTPRLAEALAASGGPPAGAVGPFF